MAVTNRYSKTNLNTKLLSETPVCFAEWIMPLKLCKKLFHPNLSNANYTENNWKHSTFQNPVKTKYKLHTATLHAFNGPGLPRWASTRKVKPIWILLKQETVSGRGICWAICKSAPRRRQITMPAPHHSVFYRPDALPTTQPTASKHWRLQGYTSYM